VTETSWKNYPCSGFYDELMKAPGEPREAARELYRYLSDLDAKELEEHRIAADVAIQVMGITFTVYSEAGMIDRVWPFDLIPRIIPRPEWQHTEDGLKQRVQALNMFIDDL
jgi:uncharacterized circularly permuted ATP-grasp superfamily protein